VVGITFIEAIAAVVAVVVVMVVEEDAVDHPWGVV